MGLAHPTFTVIDQTIHAHTVSRMAAPDLYDPAPIGISAETLSLFDTMCSRMPAIAEAVNAFNDPRLRERAFYEMVSILNPVKGEDEPDPLEIGRLAAYLTVLAAPGETATDVALRVLGPLAREAAPEAPAWWTQATTDGGLRREPDRVDDRERP